jgi:hypothetical protein
VEEYHQSWRYPVKFCANTLSTTSIMTYHVGDVYEQGCQFGCGFCDKKFFQKIMEEEEVSESDGNWDLGRDED